MLLLVICVHALVPVVDVKYPLDAVPARNFVPVQMILAGWVGPPTPPIKLATVVHVTPSVE
jgi:hypothetical protein